MILSKIVGKVPEIWGAMCMAQIREGKLMDGADGKEGRNKEGGCG